MSDHVPDPPPAGRNADGTWTAGTSGNPGGRPMWRAELSEAFADKCASRAETVLFKAMGGEEVVKGQPVTTKDAINAAKIVLQYVLPPPKQEISVESKGPTPFEGLTPHALVDLIRQMKGMKDNG